MSCQLQAPAASLLEKEPQYLMGRRLDGPQNQSRHSGEEKNS